MTWIGRFSDWSTDPGTPAWKPLLAGFGILAAVTGVIALVLMLVLTHADFSCPKGQSLTVVTYMPVTISKVTTMSPVYGCTGG